MFLSIGRRIALGLAPALIALVAVGWFAYEALRDIEAEARQVPMTVELLQRLGDLSADLAEAESETRGFRLYREERFHDAAMTAAARIRTDTAHLQRLVGDSPVLAQRVHQLELVLAQRIAALTNTLNRSRMVDVDTDPQVRQLALHGQGLGAQARAVIEGLKAEIGRLLVQRRAEADAAFRESGLWILGLTLLSFVIAGLAGAAATRSITAPLERLRRGTERVGAGDYSQRVDAQAQHEIGQLAAFFNGMTDRIQQREKTLGEQHWVKASVARFSPLLQSDQSVEAICEAVASELARLLDAQHVAMYLRRADDAEAAEAALVLCGSYAAHGAPRRLALGDGLAGQCARDGQALRLHDLPDDYVRVHSALGSTRPRALLLQPALFQGEVNAVVEIALMAPPTEAQSAFIADFAQSLGLAVNALEAKRRLQGSLQAQTRLTDSLTHTNQELEAQAEQIRASERSLREQQEALRQSNDEQQQANTELRQMTIELNEKARQLAEASGYKSQFLANMSHELRTPLNSLLILSKLLADNSEQTLTPKQIEYAQTIRAAGSDLLELINEVLDLAKIESGTVSVESADLYLQELVRSAQRTFEPIAQNKGLALRIDLGTPLPSAWHTDPRRVWQIVKNLLSNAFKFTDHGEVVLAVSGMSRQGESWLAIQVRDTGIGIAPERQADVFEAFRQVESGPARKYGGTGLGLAISRKLADMLGGELTLESAAGAGSSFTLLLPQTARSSEATHDVPLLPAPEQNLPDRTGVRQQAAAAAGPPVSADAHVLAIVADDMLQLVQQLGASCGLVTTVLQDPDDAVTACGRLRVAMIVIDATLGNGRSWIALGQLRQDPALRHIPIHVMAPAHERERAAMLGASSFLAKPPSVELLSAIMRDHMQRLARSHRKLLVVEDDDVQRKAVIELIGNGDVLTTGVATGAAALEALAREPFDCVILDLGLPDMDGEKVLAALDERYGAQCPPVLVYTGRPISREQERRLKSVAQTVIVKGVRSPERLLHETAILLNRLQARLPKAKQQMIERARRDDPALSGRKVLVVDDDVRNVFAITAALEDYGVTVLNADSGAAAIETLHGSPDIDLVLMDVMMPVMDGLEATRRLRALPQFAALPIFIITAKAMPGDRDQCLAAGASDYLTKPLDMERLKAMARAWLANGHAK